MWGAVSDALRSTTRRVAGRAGVQWRAHLGWVRRPDLAVRVREHAQVLVHRDAAARRARKGQRGREVCRACARAHGSALQVLGFLGS